MGISVDGVEGHEIVSYPGLLENDQSRDVLPWRFPKESVLE